MTESKFTAAQLQDKAGELVAQHVFCCQSCLVDMLLQNETFSYDDIENCSYYEWEDLDGHWHETPDQKELNAEIEDLEEKRDDMEERLEKIKGSADVRHDGEYVAELIMELDKIKNKIEELEKLDTSTREIFEWWYCSDYLIDRLTDAGYPILRTDYGDWWSRTCTGQAIKLDGFFEKWAEEALEREERNKS